MLGAFRQFRIYPLQSVLIALAVALGVAVVTAVVATLNQSYRLSGSGIWQRQLTLQTKANDWQGFYDGATPIPVREVGLLNEEKVRLILDDLARAKEAAPTVDYAYVTTWTSFTAHMENGETFDLDLRPVTAEYLDAVDVQLIQGSLPSASDFGEARKVILLSEEMVKRFGLEGDPVGQSIRLEDFDGENSYTVVGVLEGTETNFDGPSTFIPYKPAPWEMEGLQELSFAVQDKADLAQARTELQAFAEKTWGERVTVNAPHDQNAEAQLRLMTVVIAAFASTALAAAALNIMNLMLARVLKGRHRIGILRSLGASRAHILWQFLGESLLLGLLGGLLGVAAGYGLYAVYNSYQLAFYGSDFSNFIAGFPPLALPVGLGLALLTSLLFGFYPAYQASRLSPVEALKEV